MRAMRLDVSLNLRLSQQLRLAPQIIQSIEILQLPAMDLRDLVENELQENEALEILEPAPDTLPDLPEGGREEDGSFDPGDRIEFFALPASGWAGEFVPDTTDYYAVAPSHLLPTML